MNGVVVLLIDNKKRGGNKKDQRTIIEFPNPRNDNEETNLTSKEGNEMRISLFLYFSLPQSMALIAKYQKTSLENVDQTNHRLVGKRNIREDHFRLFMLFSLNFHNWIIKN